MQQDVEDLEAMVNQLRQIQAMPDADQLIMLNILIGVLADLHQENMVDAFQIMMSLDYAPRLEAFDAFIAGLRKGLEDV